MPNFHGCEGATWEEAKAKAKARDEARDAEMRAELERRQAVVVKIEANGDWMRVEFNRDGERVTGVYARVKWVGRPKQN
jgi:hypothetical protein